MEVFAAVAIGLLVLVSLAVSCRMLWLRAKGGGTPELLLGLMLFFTVGIGYPALIAAGRADAETARALFGLSNVCTNGGFALLFVFTWRVFRARERWAALLAGAGVSLLLANLVLRVHDAIVQSELRLGGEAVGQSLLQAGPVCVAYLWTAWESLRYYAQMRRRLRLGLADPVIVDRFLLWGCMALAVFIGIVLNTVALALHVDILASPLVLFGSSCTGLTQAILLFLAFLPPRAYLEWVRSRATLAAA
jgi:hypothetical protein